MFVMPFEVSSEVKLTFSQFIQPTESEAEMDISGFKNSKDGKEASISNCLAIVNQICNQCPGTQQGKEKALTVSLSPGTERLLRLRASSLGSEPGPDRSISEWLWSGARRRGLLGENSIKDAIWRGVMALEAKHWQTEADRARGRRNQRSSQCFFSIWTVCEHKNVQIHSQGS